MIRALRKSAGFSLIELSLVLVIVGLVAGSVLDVYRGYMRTKVTNDTKNHRKAITDAIANYVAVYKKLPCPADPMKRLGTAAAGAGQCAAGGGVVEVPGHRKTTSTTGTWGGYAPGNGQATPPFPVDPILIGAVPYQELGISVQDTLDGWGHRFLYAMSKNLKDATKFSYDNGVIDVMKLQNVDIGGGVFQEMLIGSKQDDISACPAPTCSGAPRFDMRGSYLYIVLSHGRDGKGAYTYDGNLIRPCGSTPGRDNENCNNDKTFIDASPDTNIYTTVHAPGATDPDVYFDDTATAYTLSRSNDKWSYQDSTHMYNKELVFVGIGTSTPTTNLDVNGNIKVQDRMNSASFCSLAMGPKPERCFPTTMITGPDGSLTGSGRAAGCPGQIMVGVADGKAICANQTDLTVLTGGCGTQKVVGILPSGAFQCAP